MDVGLVFVVGFALGVAFKGFWEGEGARRSPYIDVDVLDVVGPATFRARLRGVRGPEGRVQVHLAGIETPELYGSDPGEAKAAKRARRALEQRLRGARVDLLDARAGGYLGGLVARVLVDGKDLAGLLIAAGFGRVPEPRPVEAVAA